ncbi:hypothetical protein NPIL_185081 [Nephila pilipes]|uniref:Uncharacterized protein n=1 Tax=Nephila pilipes TaxID=299642 RepID=A0A8X6Q5G1_NEPPI|nr:hypothetical protein NPIL_185081 [Nephila pilipes]
MTQRTNLLQIVLAKSKNLSIEENPIFVQPHTRIFTKTFQLSQWARSKSLESSPKKQDSRHKDFERRDDVRFRRHIGGCGGFEVGVMDRRRGCE